MPSTTHAPPAQPRPGLQTAAVMLRRATAAFAAASALHLAPASAQAISEPEDMAAAQPAAPQGYADLVSLFEEFRAAVPPAVVDGVPDYSAKAMKRQAREAKDFLKRLARIDDSDWPVPYRVDYMLVLAEMRGLDFQHRVMRPWARDPAFYSTTNLGFGPKMHDPIAMPALPIARADQAAFRKKLEAVPRILAAARANLTDPRGDLARLAIAQKRIERNVYHQLAKDLETHHPEMVDAALGARDAAQSFLDWLEEIHAGLPPHGGVGREDYDWYLKHVLLFPYSWEEMKILGQREYERSLTFLKLEENEHRDLPMLDPVDTLAGFEALRAQADADLLRFLKEEEIMTVPDWLKSPPPEGPYVLPGDRDPEKGGPFDPPIARHFFRQAEDRNPHALRAHNLPGHLFDSQMGRRDTRPIRGTDRLYFIDGARIEGWAFYLEEMILQAGLLDDMPKAREITYILQAKRAARILPELMLHANEWTFEEALASLTGRTPYWMEPRDAIALFDLELYLRQPAYGIGYYMGKVELEALFAERAHALGRDFDLKAFHDEFHSKGLIPISLIRWEMTGDGGVIEDMR